MRTDWMFVPAAGLLALALGSCSTGAAPGAPRPVATVLPASFELGGSVAGLGLIPVEGAPAAWDIVVRDAAGLRTLYLDVDLGQPAPSATLTASPLFGVDALALAVPAGDGLHCGLVLPHPDEQAGFSGSGVVGRLVVGNAPAGRNTSMMDENLNEFDARMARRPNLTFDKEALLFTAEYGLPGDYDQDFEVAITDLTALGRQLGKGAGDRSSMASVADGDGNGLVTFADVTPIGRNYGRRADSMLLIPDHDPHLYPWDEGQVVVTENYTLIPSLEAEGDRLTERLWFNSGPTAMGRYVFSMLMDAQGNHTPSRLAMWETAEVPGDYNPHFLLAYADGTASFRYTFRGDLDCNTQVNIADLTPIFQHLGEAGPFSEASLLWNTDASANAEIDFSDKYMLELRFNAGPQEFALFASAAPGAYLADPYAPEELDPVATVDAEQSVADGQQRPLYSVPVALNPGDSLWVRPQFDFGVYGPPSEVIQVQ